MSEEVKKEIQLEIAHVLFIDIVTENLFDKIHSDRRWLPFLRKIGKAPDQLARIEFKVPPLPQEK